MTTKTLKTALFALLVLSIGLPMLQVADAEPDKIKDGKNKLNAEIKKLEKSDKQADKERKVYYKNALALLEKIEAGEDHTKEFEKLVKYIEKNGKSIKMRPDTGSLEEMSLSVGVENNNQLAFGIEDTPIHQVSTFKNYATNHSRNDCQDISQGSQTGTLTDQGNDQYLALYNSYPSTIKSGFFPNCSTHSWSSGSVAFVDVFGLTACVENNISSNNGWFGGWCDDWPTVGSLTVAQVNGQYTQGHAYQIVPALGFVV